MKYSTRIVCWISIDWTLEWNYECNSVKIVGFILCCFLGLCLWIVHTHFLATWVAFLDLCIALFLSYHCELPGASAKLILPRFWLFLTFFSFCTSNNFSLLFRYEMFAHEKRLIFCHWMGVSLRIPRHPDGGSGIQDQEGSSSEPAPTSASPSTSTTCTFTPQLLDCSRCGTMYHDRLSIIESYQSLVQHRSLAHFWLEWHVFVLEPLLS